MDVCLRIGYSQIGQNLVNSYLEVLPFGFEQLFESERRTGGSHRAQKN